MKVYRAYYFAFLVVPWLIGCSQQAPDDKAATTAIPISAEIEETREAQSYAGKATIALQEGRPAESKDLLEKSIALRPSVLEFRVGLAMAHFQLKEDASANEQLNSALKLAEQESVKNPRRIMDQIMILFLLNRDEDALRLLDKPDTESVLRDFGDKTNLIESLQKMREEIKKPMNRR